MTKSLLQNSAERIADSGKDVAGFRRRQDLIPNDPSRLDYVHDPVYVDGPERSGDHGHHGVFSELEIPRESAMAIDVISGGKAA
jgi:hypothetical protein